MYEIAVYNSSAHITQQQLVPVIAALNKHVEYNFAPFWGVQGTFVIMQPGALTPQGWWQMVLKDTIDVANDLGFHIDQNGTPFMTIDIAACITSGYSWSKAIGHEGLEALADPTAQAMCADNITVKECCDPVLEDDVDVDGVVMPNFITPVWAGLVSGSTRYDYLGKLTAPCPACTPGGCLLQRSGDGWATNFTPEALVNPSWMITRHGGRRSWRAR